ncbi:protein SINE1-like isoform X2 [Durio zibethinus]|uniref:Protein SINE1-like isoform X2 n=1 Tax=Durio zibethinus TaxID=66656 RepID=A0A6P5WUU9_DURZI|nr:protein SINE1-like isoform X2 [Durio zibethinus]
MMGRNLSPILRRELANLDKDADSRKSAMKALKSYVRDLDSKAIPVFLAQVSETKETGCVSGEYTISLYEVLARVHGVKIVPQIDSIMSTIVKTLASSAGSFPLQQACSKVVPAIARYGIDPTTPEDKKRSILSEVELIMEEMEKCQSDQMAYVKGAAYEASQTAKKIAREKGSKFENSCGSVTGSNFGRRDHHSCTRNSVPTDDRSPATASPESQTLDSFMEYDSLLESPVSMTQISSNMEYDQRSVNRKLWRYDNGGVDVSLKDGLFSAVAQGRSICDSPSYHHELSNHESEFKEEFAGFLHRSPRNELPRSATPSPQRSRSRINVDNLFTTPRKLIHSLQDPTDLNSDYCGKQSRRFRSPSSEKFGWGPTTNHNNFRHGMIYEVKGNGHLCNDGEAFQGISESVSSTDDGPADVHVQGSHEAVPVNKTETQEFHNVKVRKKKASKMFFGLLFVIVAVLTSLLWTEVQDESFYVVPT